MKTAERVSPRRAIPEGAVAGDDAAESRFVSFAQNFEDVMLWRALGHVSGGFYVDVGAQDPVLDSVSKAFYDRGWSGIDIEPVPAYAAALRQERPRNRVLECALGEHAGSEPFFVFGDSGLSTLLQGQAERNRERLGLAFATRTVETRALRDVLADGSVDEVHWLKIDVEGAEEQVLRSWQGSAVFPWVIVVEATQPNDQSPSHETWEPILIAAGYAFVYFDGLNRFYVSPAHQELRSAFLVPPNVFDRFTLAAVDRADRSFSKAEHYAKSLEAETAQQRDALQEKTDALRDVATRRSAEMEKAAVYATSLEAELAARGDRLQHLEGELARVRETLARTDLERESQRTNAARHQEALQTASVYARSLETELAAHAERLQVLEQELVRVRAAIEEMVEQHRLNAAEQQTAYASLEAYARGLEAARIEQQAALDEGASALSSERAARERAAAESRRLETALDEARRDAESAISVLDAQNRDLLAALSEWRTMALAQWRSSREQTNDLAKLVARPPQTPDGTDADPVDPAALRQAHDTMREERIRLFAEVERLASELQRRDARWHRRLRRWLPPKNPSSS